MNSTFKLNPIYVLLISLLLNTLFSCERDTLEQEDIQENLIESINPKIASADHFYSKDSKLKETIAKMKTNSNKSTSSSIYNFSIFESRVQLINFNSFKLYTFEVFRDTINVNKLENYILKQNDDNTIQQYLVEYDINLDGSHSINNILPIDDPELDITKSSSCNMELVASWDETVCTDILCSIEGHEYGGNGCWCGTTQECEPIDTVCETTTYFIFDEDCGGGGTGTDPGDWTPSTGAGGNTTSGANTGTIGNNTIVANPIMIASKAVLNFIQTLPQDQQDWINDLNCGDLTLVGSSCNPQLYEDIILFLNANELNQRTSDFIVFVYNALETNTNLEFAELLKFYNDDLIEFLEQAPSNNVPVIPDYDSIDVFISSLTDESFEMESSEILDIQTGKRKDIAKVPINNWPEATIVASVIVKAPDLNGDGIIDSFEVLNVNTTLEGITSFFEWEQTDHSEVSNPEGPTITLTENTVKVEVYGDFKTGLKVFGEAMQVTRVIKIVLYYDLETGELKTDLCHWQKI